MSTSRIRLGGDEMRYIALFENITGATANDCVIEGDRMIFVAKPGEMGLAIGKGGKNINMLRKMTGKPIEVVEFAGTVEGPLRCRNSNRRRDPHRRRRWGAEYTEPF